MFALALIIGIYSYAIFSVGVAGVLYSSVVLTITILFLLLALYYFKNDLLSLRDSIQTVCKMNNFSKILLGYLILQSLVNLIGALGPELAFDALWYHLTLPKIYLMQHAIVHIPGGVFYYSDMPKLAETLYTAALALQGETTAKLIHFLFGILTVVALYKVASRYFSQSLSLLVAAVFYANLVVAWESTTAYIDLTRVFFEIMALWGFLLWQEKNDRKWLVESAVMMGLAITTKVLALGSLVLFLMMIGFSPILVQKKQSVTTSVKIMLLYCLIALIIPLPWFFFSFLHTGNPVYPFFTSVYDSRVQLRILNPVIFLIDTWTLFTHEADPLLPLYLMLLPLFVLFYRRFSIQIKIVAWYAFGGLILWYVTPRTGGGRFILAYLPAFSLLVGGVFDRLHTMKGRFGKQAYEYLFYLCLFLFFISLFYRFFANSKFIPVIAGFESKDAFLTKHLNFSFGDFYDTDGYFRKTIKKNDVVLLYGFHNLYYADFPFIDSSYVKPGDKFDYIAVQNGKVPDRFKYWDLVYSNEKTHVDLYTFGRTQWTY